MRQAIAIPPWSHNPETVRAPDGTWVIFTLGPGMGKTHEQNCSAGAITTGDSPDNPVSTAGEVACSAVSENTDFNGHDLHPACGVANVTEAGCCSACGAMPQCTAFTFIPSHSGHQAQNTCCLKSSVEGKRAIPGYQSGTIPGRVPPPTPPKTVNFTVHSASSPHGPWTATTMEVFGWNASWTLEVRDDNPRVLLELRALLRSSTFAPPLRQPRVPSATRQPLPS